MTGRVDAARAAKEIADWHVGADGDMTNAHLLVDDGKFRTLAVVRQQLTLVDAVRPEVYSDTPHSEEDQYVMAQVEVALQAVDRALSCRAATVFLQAYRIDWAEAGQ
jgi:hypothetical protein